MSHASPRNIVLIGMRACGKTSLGRQLARRLGMPFVDLDDEIGRRSGGDADALLAEQGEDTFRTVERRVLGWAATLTGHVIATGGGAVTQARAFGPLAETGVVVYLQASEAELARRALARPRPALTAAAPQQEVATLLGRREPLYRAAAQITIPVERGDPILALLHALDAR